MAFQVGGSDSRRSTFIRNSSICTENQLEIVFNYLVPVDIGHPNIFGYPFVAPTVGALLSVGHNLVGSYRAEYVIAFSGHRLIPPPVFSVLIAALRLELF